MKHHRLFPLIAAAVLLSCTAETLTAQEIRITPGPELFEFTPYEIKFSGNGVDPFYFGDDFAGLGLEGRRGNFIRDGITLEEWGYVDAGGFVDRVAVLHGRDRFEPVDIVHYRIRRRYDLLPGAITLVSGSMPNLGDDIVVQVRVPQGKLFFPDHPKYSPAHQFDLKLFRIGSPIRGGALRSDEEIDRQLIEEPLIRHTYEHALGPGVYEVRLQTNGHGDCVVDRKKFMVLARSDPGALSLKDKDRLTELGNLDFTVELTNSRPGLLEDNRYEVRVEIYRASKFGTLMPPRYEFSRRVDADGDVRFHADDQGFPPGNYAAQLTIEPWAGDAFVLDRMNFQISSDRNEQFSYVSVGPEEWFDPGEKISIEADVGQNPADARYTLELYSLTREYLRARNESSDAVIPIENRKDTWEVEPREARVITLSEGLPLGFYELRLLYNDDNIKDSLSEHCRFRVAPKFGEAKVETAGRDSFLTSEEIPTTVVLPEGLDSCIGESYLRLTRLGGRVPGCAVETDRIIEKSIILDDTAAHTFPPLDRAGDYRIDLYVGDKNWTENSKLLARRKFTVGTKRYMQAINLPKTTFFPEETFMLGVNMPPGYRAERPQFTSVQLIRNGYVAHGGAEQFPHLVRSFDFEYSENGRAEVSLKAPRFPGFYEFRLYDRLRSETSGEPVISWRRFQVVAPNSPFEIDQGPTGAKPPLDLPLNGYPWVPEGHYAELEDCNDLSLEPQPEEMDLRFVRYVDRQYVPVEGAIDFGEGVYLEGRLRYAAFRQYYAAQISGPNGGEPTTVVLEPDEDEVHVVRSKRLYMIWPPPQ